MPREKPDAPGRAGAAPPGARDWPAGRDTIERARDFLRAHRQGADRLR